MTGHHKAYPKYKDSDVEWLGHVPFEWNILRLKHLCSISTGDRDNIHKSNDGEFPFFVRSKNIERINSYSFDGEAVLTAGDGDIGKIFHYVNGKFDFHQRVYKFSDFKNVNGRYFYHYISCHLADEVVKLSAKTTVDSLRLPMLQNFVFCVPPLIEQAKIINFVDHETAKIDTLIEKQQQLIQLLKEKRQAVISHAVTKGLNPNAPMKDSGVEWTDKVPNHWKVTKLRYYAVISNGATPNRENIAFWENGNIGWLNSSKVNDQIIKSADQFITELAVLKTSVKAVKENDLVMAITGEGQTRGRVAICKIEATINQHLASISIVNNALLHEFLYAWLVANYERIRFESNAAGSTKGAITCSDIESFPIVVPPIREQLEILALIKNEMLKFDQLETKATSAIELMQERRTALISAAVTGKIDVRNWQAKAVKSMGSK